MEGRSVEVFIDQTLKSLEQAAIPIKIPRTQLPNGSIIAMVEDPDGNIVEFSQEICAAQTP
ncbi:MAG: VOC family protein [Cyanobacteria bacterium P01_D01_bin.156]